MENDSPCNGRDSDVEPKKATARRRAQPGPPPTLIEEMQAGYRWFWFWCPLCERRTPKALAPFVVRYGPKVPTIDVAKRGACSACGHRGALLQRPCVEGTGADMMIEPFPAHLAMRGLERWLAPMTRTRCPAPMRYARRSANAGSWMPMPRTIESVGST